MPIMKPMRIRILPLLSLIVRLESSFFPDQPASFVPRVVHQIKAGRLHRFKLPLVSLDQRGNLFGRRDNPRRHGPTQGP